MLMLFGRSLLLGFMRDEDAAVWKGFLFAGLLFLLSCLQSLLNHQYMYRCFTLGMRLKSAVMALVYRKVSSGGGGGGIESAGPCQRHRRVS